MIIQQHVISQGPGKAGRDLFPILFRSPNKTAQALPIQGRQHGISLHSSLHACPEETCFWGDLRDTFTTKVIQGHLYSEFKHQLQMSFLGVFALARP